MPSSTQPWLDCTAVLMAGGRSSRMGRDKAWLEHRGRPLWESQLKKLRFAREIFISARKTTFAEAPSGCRLIFDEATDRGPLAGLQSALKLARFDRLILLAVDMPEMSSEYLSRLVQQSSGDVGVVPEVGGFYEGLAAVYPGKIASLVDGMLAGPEGSFQDLCRRAIALGVMKSQTVGPEESFLFTNWNRPEDLDPQP